jgi:NIMA (never in mitosis gene a)-related kinase
MDTRQMKEDNKKQIYNEASIMKKLFHPNIISFKDVFKDTKLDYFYIVMEYANDGDLSKKIKTQKQKTYGDKYFSEEKILQYFDQICRGLQYIHSKNIIHRDIKTQNIFLMKNGKVKIGDFGISKALTNTKNNASTIIGTPYYFSPEIINGEPYNYKTDIWSLGVVLYEMCCLKLPFESNNIAQLSIKILRGKYDPIPNRYSKNMANLIKQMLNIDQKLRPSIFEVIQSPLLKNYHINKNSNKSYKNLIKNKKYILNTNEPQLNFKPNEQILDQRQNERKSDVNKHKYKEKSCSPIKFKNKSYVGKLIKKNNDHSDSPFELPKASNKKKSKKSNIFKRISTQNNMIQNINEDFMISKINKVNSSNNISNNLYNNNNFNIIKSQNHIFKSNNNINNNIINKNINIKSTNNIINTNINRIDIKQNLNVNKSSSNNLQNKNIFYNDILTNKEEIINRSNEFDINFSGKSMLFDKEKTIHLINEEKDKNLIKDNNGKEKLENGNKPFNENIIQNNYINESLYNFNFDEQSIKMFTLKEEEEEETIKSNGTLYNNTDIDNLNFEIKKNENKEIENEKIIQDNNERNTKKNEKINNISKEDLNFEIINNPIIQENHIKKEKKFHLEDYIKQQIGEKMYLIIKQNWLDFNIEQIVNYNYDTIINKLRDVLKKNEFREREIKKAEMYMFDVFFNLINKPKL